MSLTETLALENRTNSQALAEHMQADAQLLATEWQQRLEQIKNNISIFVSVEKRRQGLCAMVELLMQCLQRADLEPFRSKTVAIARLRAGQGFNLKDCLEESLILEDLLFQWACKTFQQDPQQVLQVVEIVHRLSHAIVQDVARVHVQAMDRNLRRQKQESLTDGLTHLFNYRFFKEFLQKEIYRSSRYQHPASLVLIDVDLFKKLNDTHGHIGGDQILAQLALLAQGNCRVTDLVCRYGGEEFAILLPETPKEQAVLYCERLRSLIEQNPFALKNGPQTVRITVSVGMATYPEDSAEALDLIHKADQALYMAKRGGRNRVCYYGKNGSLRTA